MHHKNIIKNCYKELQKENFRVQNVAKKKRKEKAFTFVHKEARGALLWLVTNNNRVITSAAPAESQGFIYKYTFI